jgi:hypothetical protein
MTHVPVQSSNLESVAFEDGTLEIKFKGNPHLYRYQATADEHKTLMGAPSKGKYFAATFKKRAFQKIKPES